jgi:hypothetical protein
MAKVALLIGVSEYKPGLNALPAAVKDVAALQRILQDSEVGGFDEVKVLTNPDPQSMQYEVETLFTGRTKDDLVLLFFSGHGIKDDSNNLYFATRITQKNLKGDLIRSTAVPARFIHEVMHNSRAKRQAIILDCCFSGAFDPTLQTKDDGSVDLQGQLGAEGRVVLTSSSSTQYSFEQQGSDLSLYTRYLVEGIETGAGDRDEDGKISIRELHDYATSKVQEAAPNMTPKLITLKEMGFDIVLAKAKVTDPQLRYRRQVERYSSRGSISSIGRTILDQLQTQLGLSPEITKEIEAEVLLPYQKRLENLQRYGRVFSEAIGHEYPLSNHARSELEDLREVLGLRQEDINSVEQDLVAQIVQKPNFEQDVNHQKLQQPRQEPIEETVTNQQIAQFTSEQQNEDRPNSPSKNNQITNPLNKNRSRKVVVIATSSIFTLLVGGILTLNKSLLSGNKNHNEGVGNAPTQAIENTELSTVDQKLSIIDQIIQSPNQPIPAYSPTLNSLELDSLSIERVNALNDLFNRFNKVENSSEPVTSGSSTSYGEWNALCLGEQGQSQCPKSARHEVLSYAGLPYDGLGPLVFLTSRGWVLYK